MDAILGFLLIWVILVVAGIWFMFASVVWFVLACAWHWFKDLFSKD